MSISGKCVTSKSISKSTDFHDLSSVDQSIVEKSLEVDYPFYQCDKD